LDRKPGSPGFFYFCEDKGMFRAPRVLVLLVLALAGCSGGNLIPFFGGEAPEASRKPANATEYRCEGGVSLYVRQLDGGAVWLIAPDREIRLNKKAEGRYVYERVELDIDKDRLDLIDPPTNRVDCKRVGGTAASSPRL
jgi:hypothetical protein